MMDWPLLAAALLAFVIIIYVILDGFDLGIGILFPYVANHEQRDVMMNSVAPVWDGNETWLVMGGSLLYGAFPIAYSLLLPLLYIPILLMLAALIFRGVAFEFRFKSIKNRMIWDASFAMGSTIAAFMQGIILGTFVQGYDNIDLQGAVNYQWLTPFTLLSGIALVFGYALLGATWLIGKTTGPLQNKMYIIAKVLLPIILSFILIVSIWTPLLNALVWQRWFSWPNTLYLLPLPLATIITALWAWIALSRQQERLPFYLVISIFIFCYAGFGISAWPYLIPHRITFWEAASNTTSLKFILIGAFLLLPVLIAYTLYTYRIFRGKISEETGYH